MGGGGGIVRQTDGQRPDTPANLIFPAGAAALSSHSSSRVEMKFDRSPDDGSHCNQDLQKRNTGCATRRCTRQNGERGGRRVEGGGGVGGGRDRQRWRRCQRQKCTDVY